MNSIKAVRKHAGLTQSEVSESLGIPLSTLRRWEQGVNEPDVKAIIKLANYYCVSTDTLLGSQYAEIEVLGPQEDLTSITLKEWSLLEAFRALNDKGQDEILEIADAFVRSKKYK